MTTTIKGIEVTDEDSFCVDEWGGEGFAVLRRRDHGPLVAVAVKPSRRQATLLKRELSHAAWDLLHEVMFG